MQDVQMCLRLNCPKNDPAAFLPSTRFPTGTRQRCEAELAKLDKQISRKERELEGVNRQLEEATARQGG